MEVDFEMAYKAWSMNQIQQFERKNCDNSYAIGNENAKKLTDEQIDIVVNKLRAGQRLHEIYEELFRGYCTINALRSRIRKRGINLNQLNKQMGYKR